MFEIDKAESEIQMIDFGQDGKVLFRLPQLGQKGLPVGLMSAFAIFYDKVHTTGFTDRATASAWAYFIDVLRTNYPDAILPLSRLDEDQLSQVISHWVQKSPGFDPKA